MAWTRPTYTLVDAANADGRSGLIRVRPSSPDHDGDGPAGVLARDGKVSWLAPFDGVPGHWVPQIDDAAAGSWVIDERDGALLGRVEGEQPAILWCDLPLEGDHMIEFQASTVPPSDHDINVIWEGTGHYSGTDPEQFCTIAGLGSWWGGYSGIERSLGNETGATGRFVTKGDDLLVGQIHTVAAGRVGPHDFLFVDGRLAQQVSQEGAPRRGRSRVALTTWDSAIKIHAIRISTIEMASPEAG